MMQQLLLRYQIPQYDRHYFPVTGILLIFACVCDGMVGVKRVGILQYPLSSDVG